ncbi:hypothetical protein LT85_2187 [Collimonas arenae]|uniref:Uncharacterized protein n=1 Tax=Collimonas arenae TaxID=279058 RepID=A0A0A1FC58_9BURK|nr:hypothetical protein [Collimonas arenae]AIY41345.1 hypothetical protein LT85_2187 [Collimonas arenae]
MSAWLSATKAILPYVSDIISVAAPVFTRRKGNTEESQVQILQQQVVELQSASLQNAVDIKALAEQFKAALPLLEREIEATDAKLARAHLLCGLSVGVAILALVVSFMALLNK